MKRRMKLQSAWLFIAALLILFASIMAAFAQGRGGGQGATVNGTLVEKGTLKPIVGRQVLLCPIAYEKGNRVMTMTVDFNRDTNTKGEFSFTGVPVGTYGLVSFHLMQRSELFSADGKPIDIVIKSSRETINLGRIPVEVR